MTFETLNREENMSDKELAVKSASEVGFVIPDEDMGQGFDEMEGQDFAAPFLVIVQTTSPYLNPTHQLYVPEAKPATIINTMNNRIYPTGVTVIPCKYSFRHVEWRPRSTGGGFVASYTRENTPTDLSVNPLNNKTVRPNGNEIMATSYYLCLLVEEDYEKVIIPFTSTQLKKARKWNTLMASLKKGGKSLPIFSHYYNLSLVGESNNKGSWFGWKIDIGDGIESEVYQACKQTASIGDFLPDSLIKAHQAAEAPTDTNAF